MTIGLLRSLAVTCGLMLAGVALAEEPRQRPMVSAIDQEAALSPGDYGYRHDEFHDAYRALWQGGKCWCDRGGCRVTEWRIGPNNQVQVIVNREWRDVPSSARLPDAGVPPKLWEAPAHVCATNTMPPVIECVAIASGM